MDRTQIVQTLLNRQQGSCYLEIGVYRGENFYQIKADVKHAVDPCFHITNSSRIKACIKDHRNLKCKYFQTTSNAYFECLKSQNPSFRYDVIFIDGLHTYEQTMQDVQNSMEWLSPGGYVVMHDCSPPHAAAAYPAESLQAAAQAKVPGWTGEWCGDVWKTICHLRATREDLQVMVVDCDYGVGVLRQGPAGPLLELDPNMIPSLTFEDLAAHRTEWLNLIPPSQFPEILDK